MYKKILPILFLSVAANVATAQVTLTAATTNPQVGDVNLEYFTGYTDIGDSGTNITWDFSSDAGTASDTQSFAACSSSPYCADFDSSNIYYSESGYPNGTFLQTNSNLLSVTGTNRYSRVNIYSDNEDLLRYPFTYHTVYTDPFTSLYDADSSDETHYSGQVTVRGDAYGTLILPYQIFTNVLRVHRSETYNETNSFLSLSISTDSYTWYSTDIRDELMNISYVYNSMSGDFSTTSYYRKGIATGVNSVNNTNRSTSIFPNPATDKINIRFDNQSSNAVYIGLFDVVGKQVGVINNGTLNKGAQQLTYSTQGLAKGIYFIKIQSDNNTETRKVQIL